MPKHKETEMHETIAIDIDRRGVATLTLARPEKHNTLSAAMIAELTAAAAHLGEDPLVRVVVLAATGASFCAGGDLQWMRAQIAADDATRRDAARALAMMLRALDRMPKPLIGRVQGAAYGGGVGILAVCDIAIGVAEAKFGLTETRLGLIPATISPYVVARIGVAAARRHMLGARLFDADEAHRIGLLGEVVGAHDLDAAVERAVLPFLSCAPGAVAASKALVHHLGQPIDDTLIEATIDQLVLRWQDPEATEGIAAFFEKRRASWDWREN
jgi:methylglutaconyl-CoA hydratase